MDVRLFQEQGLDRQRQREATSRDDGASSPVDILPVWVRAVDVSFNPVPERTAALERPTIATVADATVSKPRMDDLLDDPRPRHLPPTLFSLQRRSSKPAVLLGVVGVLVVLLAVYLLRGEKRPASVEDEEAPDWTTSAEDLPRKKEGQEAPVPADSAAKVSSAKPTPGTAPQAALPKAAAEKQTAEAPAVPLAKKEQEPVAQVAARPAAPPPAPVKEPPERNAEHPYPVTENPWPLELEPDREARRDLSRPLAEFRGTIEKPNLRAQHDDNRSGVY